MKMKSGDEREHVRGGRSEKLFLLPLEKATFNERSFAAVSPGRRHLAFVPRRRQGTLGMRLASQAARRRSRANGGGAKQFG